MFLFLYGFGVRSLSLGHSFHVYRFVGWTVIQYIVFASETPAATVFYLFPG